MSRLARTVRACGAMAVLGAASFALVPPQAAFADSQSSLTPNVEAWYQPNLTCLLPTGCLTPGSLPVAVPSLPSLPAANPYPAKTLHVGVNAGMEAERTYLRFPFAQLDGSNVTGATLNIPLDTNTQDGSTLPETSKVAVCETSSSNFTNTEGTTDAPPPLDCKVSVVMKYVATPAPHLTAALGSMAADLPGITGLVLVPDMKTTAKTDAWQVVFSAHDRTDAAKTAPATLAVTYTGGSGDSGSFDDGSGDTSDGTTTTDPGTSTGTGVSGIVPSTGTGFASPPLTSTLPETLSPTVSGNAPTQGAPVTTEPRLITVGYMYPVVWLLPLGFLILVPAVARALTKDLSGEE